MNWLRCIAGLAIAGLALAGANVALSQQLPSEMPAPPGTRVPQPAIVQQSPQGTPVSPGTIVKQGPGGDVQKSIASPVVGKESIGFYNSSNQPISFIVASDGASQAVDLLGHEILTLRYPGGATVTGTIGTGANDVTASLARGAIYVIAAQNGRWIFRPL